MSDLILNGQGIGPIAQRLIAAEGNPSVFRPWVGDDGQAYILGNEKGKEVAVRVHNANATLRKDEWKLLDDAVIAAAKPRLRLVNYLRSQGLQFTIPNGMGKTVLETQRQSDISAATISMEPLRQGEADRPVYDLSALPLPVTHKDFSFSARQIMASRNGGSPLDTTTAALAARRVAESIEQLVLGTLSAYTFGGGTIYGILNSTEAIAQVLTAPTATGWTGATLVSEVLAMKLKSVNEYHYGPWLLIAGPSWDPYLDDDYSTAKGDNTLRERLAKIEGIAAVLTVDYITDYGIALVQLTPDTIRIIVGLELMTLQWETEGGMQVNFKVMSIQVPQVRGDFNGNAGIVVGATA